MTAVVTPLSVVSGNETERSYAEHIAAMLKVPFNDMRAPIQLLVDDSGLSLRMGQQKPIRPNFCWLDLKKRRQQGGVQAIVRACKPTEKTLIVDATAGWGRDAAILASFGARVIMLERNPVLALLLQDALARRDALSRERLKLELIITDAKDWLQALLADQLPDIIYMDPMHPERSKSALVKKDLHLLQNLIGADLDALSLLQIGRTRAKKKVVVKWPQKHPPLEAPDYAITGKTIRYDCYHG